MQHRVYFDSASTTEIHPQIRSAYEDLLNQYYTNSESLYQEGTQISRMMEKARTAIAGLLDVSADEILFTSGSCESNSSAIKSVCLASPERKHIITTQVEHSSILNACAQMERLFHYRITYLPVNEQGVIRISDLQEALTPDTVLVSVMHVNNESGAVNPMDEISETVQKRSQAYMHTDLTQAIGKVSCSLKQVDLASISAHKLHGLKGSGILMKKKHVPFEPLISGGEQEYGLRGGTSNALADMMFARTLRLALEDGKQDREWICSLHQHLLKGLEEIPGIEINSPTDGVPDILNFSYEPIPSEVMQNALNEKGFMVSARSTCASKSDDPSYVLKAMGFSDRRASSCIRISFSKNNTQEEIDWFLDALKEIIAHYG